MWFWFFIGSLSLNIVALFYVKWLLKTIQAINEDVINLSDMLGDFSNHISSVHEMEMFYGDQTLTGLLEHGNDLVAALGELDLILNKKEDINAEEEK